MGLWEMFGNIYFSSYADVVDFLASYIPVFMLIVFILNCFFSIFYDFIYFGGKK